METVRIDKKVRQLSKTQKEHTLRFSAPYGRPPEWWMEHLGVVSFGMPPRTPYAFKDEGGFTGVEYYWLEVAQQMALPVPA